MTNTDGGGGPNNVIPSVPGAENVTKGRNVRTLISPWNTSPPAVSVRHVINSEDILEMLRRAHDGEDPDLLYIELYANGPPDDEDV